jgi:hypothetical protein
MGMPTTPEIEPEAGRWYHVAVTFGAEQSEFVDPAVARQAVSPFGSGAVSEEDARNRARALKFYLDGELIGVAPHHSRITTEASDFALGANPHLAGEEFVGKLAGFALFEGALDAVAITRLSTERPGLT